MTRTCFAVCLTNLVLVSSASAHYLFLKIDAQPGDNGTVNLYFQEGPRPGPGKYLDPFIARGKNWVRTMDKSADLEMLEVKKDDKRWLAAELPTAAPRSAESYVQWGVYPYGKTNVLLHYHAKHVQVDSSEQLDALSRSDKLKLDVVAKQVGDGLQLQVLWQGKPAAGRPVYVRGPESKTVTTDEKGVVTYKPTKPGLFTFRTHISLKEEGQFDGKDYQEIRHHSTLTLSLPLQK